MDSIEPTPFLPGDNVGSGSVQESDAALGALLRLDATRFRREVVTNEKVKVFLDSYLASRHRPYDFNKGESSRHLASIDRRCLTVLARCAEEGVGLDASRVLAAAGIFGMSNPHVLATICHTIKPEEWERCIAASIEAIHAALKATDGVDFCRDATLSLALVLETETAISADWTAMLTALEDFAGKLDAQDFSRLALALPPADLVDWLARSGPSGKAAELLHNPSQFLSRLDSDDTILLDYARKLLLDISSPEGKIESPNEVAPVVAQNTQDILAERVNAVKAVLGDTYGDGYLAACLAVSHLDAEIVVARLLENNPPPQVKHLDPRLEAVAARDEQRQHMNNPTEDPAFLRQQKRRVAALEAQAEEALRLRELYDDDYDDRYDQEEVGKALEIDQEAIRRLNASRRAEEDESKFWQDQRNTNREGSSKPLSPAPAEIPQPSSTKQDKISPANASNKNHTAIRRKRAEKHKAAVANHHRRDRAARKVGGPSPFSS